MILGGSLNEQNFINAGEVCTLTFEKQDTHRHVTCLIVTRAYVLGSELGST